MSTYCNANTIEKLHKLRPPSWTCVLGRWRQPSSNDRDVDRRRPSCSWHRTSAASTLGRSELGTVGCHATSVARSRAWKSGDGGREPCWRPVYGDQRSTTATTNEKQKMYMSVCLQISTKHEHARRRKLETYFRLKYFFYNEYCDSQFLLLCITNLIIFIYNFNETDIQNIFKFR